MSDRPAHEIVAERLEEAGLPTDRFIDVKEGSKASVDHSQHAPGDVGGNYGIYANGNDQLAILDIDDYGDPDDKSGLSALHQLPPTLEQGSPHDGTHRLYRVEPTEDGRLVAAALKDAFGSANLAPSWGEVRVQNQYVVGAGSQLHGCDKDWCDRCADPDGGYYVIQNDREIETIDCEQLIDVLASDPSLSKDTADESADVTAFDDAPSETPDAPDDVDERLTYAREHDDKLDRLMRGDYSDYGGDRSKSEYVLAYKLAFWLGDDRRTIEQVLDHDAHTQKWAERQDRSYRDSVLQGVDDQTEFYTPGSKPTDDSYSPEVDWDEVDRGEAILDAERGVTDPYGALVHQDGHYGYNVEVQAEDGHTRMKFVSVTNFTLELDHVIETYEGKLLTITIYPASPMEDPYTVEVKPTVFNSPRTFSEEIVRGRTTLFNPQRDVTETLNNLRLTVGHQTAPQHVGTEYIGLHGQNYEEWVTPAGTLSVDGWLDQPRHKYYEKGGNQDMESSLEDKWDLVPSEGADYDPETVGDICERLPRTRLPDRGLPILGWFYAAPLKPIIHEIEGEFNLLQVTGDTEAGKTSTLQLYYQLFGADPAPFGCGDTNFTIEKKLSGSCGLPIWLDEYKPSDLGERKLKWLHRRLREVTREKSVSKGQQDLGEITFKMRAPVVFSGEQTVQDPAARRRAIMTHLTDQATTGRQQEAFAQLVGATYTNEAGEEQYPDGYDLDHHALAFYQHILAKDPETLREGWRAARERTQKHLRALNVPDLDGSEFQGLQTIVFGVGVFREFATAFDVPEESLPSDEDVRRALDHVVSNIGPGGRRREHIDEFVELMAQAASAGYLEEDVHHRVFEPQMNDGESALAFHMPTTFNSVKKYAREYNVEDEHSLLSKNDYIDSFRDKSEGAESYPLAVNHRVRGIENGAKAVVIDPERAAAILPDGFNLGAFSDAIAAEQEDEVDVDDPDVTPLGHLEQGSLVTITAELKQTYTPDSTKAWYELEGWLVDQTGAAKVIVREDSGISLEEGQPYRFERVNPTREDGVMAVEVVPNISSVEEISLGEGSTDPDGADWLEAPSAESESDSTARADGGSEAASPENVSDGPPSDSVGPQADAQRLVTLVAAEGSLTKSRLLALAGSRYDMDPSRAAAGFEYAVEEAGSLVQEPGSEKYTT